MSNMIRKLGLVVAFALLIMLLGCGGSNDEGGDSTPAALTENDFAGDPDLRTHFQKTVVMFLEHPEAEEPENDTYEMGIDAIPYYCEEEATYRFCWEDDNEDAQHIDRDGNQQRNYHP